MSLLDDADLSAEELRAFESMKAADAEPAGIGHNQGPELEAVKPAAAAPPPVEGQAPAEGDKPAEGAEGAKDEDEDAKRPVSYGALREEREKRRQLESQLATTNDRLNAVLQRISAPPAPPPAPATPPAPPPDPEIDPVGAQQFDRQALIGMAHELHEMKQAKEHERVTTQIVSAYKADAAAAAKEAPDFADAYNHIVELRRNQLHVASQGRMTPEQIDARIEAEEMQAVAGAIQSGMRPAVAIYRMAVASGYKPGAKPAAGAPAGGAAGAKLDAIKEAQADNRSLSGVGRGGTGATAVDARALAAMSHDQFEAWLEKNGDAAFRKIANASA